MKFGNLRNCNFSIFLRLWGKWPCKLIFCTVVNKISFSRCTVGFFKGRMEKQKTKP